MDENPYHSPQAESSGVVGAREPEKRRLLTPLTVLMVLCIGGLVVALLLTPVRTVHEAARRSTCRNNLKQLSLALHNYVEMYGTLPPAYTTDANGKPLHSWRTLILPQMELGRLYESIDLTKPWDDPVNAEACQTIVPGYQCPSSVTDPAKNNHTTYLAVVTPNSCFRAGKSVSLSEIADGTSNTLMVIEVDTEHAVPWMAPVDADEQLVMSIGPESELAHSGGVNAAFVDGSVHFLMTDDLSATDRRALISIAGNDNVAAEGAE